MLCYKQDNITAELCVNVCHTHTIFQYILAEHPKQAQRHLQQSFTRFQQDALPLFRRGDLADLDCVAVLMSILGVHVSVDEWDAYKGSLRNDLTRHLATGRAQQWQQQLQREYNSEDTNIHEDTNIRDMPKHLDSARRTIKHLLKQKRTLQQRVRRLEVRLEKQAAKHMEEICVLHKEVNSSFAATRKSKKDRSWFTPQGTVALALRRNIGNVASSLLGHVILTDVSASTVCRSEVRAAAALIASTRTFFQMLRETFRTPADAMDEHPSCVAVYSWRQDATNSGVWRRSKLSALELEAFYTDAAGCWATACQGHSLRRIADVQKIEDGTAKATVALTLKQLESLGCPTFLEFQDVDESASVLSGGWHIFCQTTDRGSNELCARGINNDIYNSLAPQVLYFDLNCVEHATHLCCLGGLAQVDVYLTKRSKQEGITQGAWGNKYFAACATLANVLRDVGQPLFKNWAHLFGAADALRHAKKLFPKCISGRWGSIHDFETRCLDAGAQKFVGLNSKYVFTLFASLQRHVACVFFWLGFCYLFVVVF